jgi:hypothetical protein
MEHSVSSYADPTLSLAEFLKRRAEQTKNLDEPEVEALFFPTPISGLEVYFINKPKRTISPKID